jgi:hypothetical protein
MRIAQEATRPTVLALRVYFLLRKRVCLAKLNGRPETQIEQGDLISLNVFKK